MKPCCRFNGGAGQHGPIVAVATSLTGKDFDICDLHLHIYRDSGIDFNIRLNYAKDISSKRAIARREELTVGLRDDLRSQNLNARKDLI